MYVMALFETLFRHRVYAIVILPALVNRQEERH